MERYSASHWFAHQSRHRLAFLSIACTNSRHSVAHELAQLQEVRLQETEKAQWLAAASSQLQTTFEALASKSLQTNADEFLKRARFCRHVCAQ